MLLFFLTSAAWIIGSLTLFIGIIYYLAIKKKDKNNNFLNVIKKKGFKNIF